MADTIVRVTAQEVQAYENAQKDGDVARDTFLYAQRIGDQAGHDREFSRYNDLWRAYAAETETTAQKLVNLEQEIFFRPFTVDAGVIRPVAEIAALSTSIEIRRQGIVLLKSLVDVWSQEAEQVMVAELVLGTDRTASLADRTDALKIVRELAYAKLPVKDDAMKFMAYSAVHELVKAVEVDENAKPPAFHSTLLLTLGAMGLSSFDEGAVAMGTLSMFAESHPDVSVQRQAGALVSGMRRHFGKKTYPCLTAA